MSPRTEQDNARTLTDLVMLGWKRGYKNPEWWAKKVMAARQRKAELRTKLTFKGKPI